jgi:hexosaminidase
LAAYPSLGCNDKQFDMPTKCYISPEILCAGKESTYTFLEDVMTEVAELFSGKFIHVGGDEAKYDRWKECQHCKKRMQQEGIDSFQQLQGYMTRRIEKFLMKKGKRLIGWDEILDCGLAPNATVMTWHRPQTAVQAAKSGNNVVMALTGHAYFDTPESDLPGEPPAATWLTPISLRNAYQWEPAPVVLNDREKKFILGAHGCLWSDRFMHDPILQDIAVLNENRSYKYLEYLSLPRMAALAEVVWTKQDQRSWEDFTARQSIQYNRYTAAGYHYRVPLPIVEKKPKSDGTFLVTMTSPVKDGTLHYTIDGTYPDVYSEIYTKPIIVNDLDKFSAVTSVGRRHYSLAFKFPKDMTKKFAGLGVELGKWQSGDISAGTYKPFDLDATGKINKNGMYELTFMYTHGSQRLDIEKVEVIVNGKVVAADEHHGTTGAQHQNNVYMLKITDFETGANYTVRARIMGDTGNDSNGQVFLLLKD